MPQFAGGLPLQQVVNPGRWHGVPTLLPKGRYRGSPSFIPFSPADKGATIDRPGLKALLATPEVAT